MCFLYCNVGNVFTVFPRIKFVAERKIVKIVAVFNPGHNLQFASSKVERPPVILRRHSTPKLVGTGYPSSVAFFTF